MTRTPLVLVVDDNRVNRRAAMKVCGNAGVATLEAANAGEALRLLDLTRCDAVLLDLRMPGLSGEELCALLRKDDRWRDLPIIAYTAHVQRAEVSRLLRGGFSEVLVKPVRVADFERALRSVGVLPGE